MPNADILSRAKQFMEGGRTTYLVFAVTFMQNGFNTQATLEIASAGKAKIRDNPAQKIPHNPAKTICY